MVRVTESHGYRQTYTHFGIGYPGYHFRIVRISDGVEMYSGPGTNVDHPPQWHPDWKRLPLEERRAIRAALDGGVSP